MKYTGEHLNEEFCRAVGINPESVDRVVIDLAVGNAARVSTQGFVETDDGKIDRLKCVLRHYELKPKGRYELKNIFKRRKPDKPVQEEKAPEGSRNCRCFIVQSEPLDLEEMGISFQIGYDDNYRGSMGAWYLVFMPSYSWKGRTYGSIGPELVKEVGLEIPLENSRAIQHGIKEDGSVWVYFQQRPSDALVKELIQDTQHIVEGIMGDYHILKAFQTVNKKKA